MFVNIIWLGLFFAGFAAALWQTVQGDWGAFARLIEALFGAAQTGFEVALGLTGMMSLWLGFMRVGERAGVVAWLARAVNPLLRQLMPGVPAGHAAQGAVTLNVSANLLGLDNAATPLGLKAMQELQSLNAHPRIATDAQIVFIALNTAGLTLIPTSVIALRQTVALQQGLAGFNAADIFLPTLLVTASSLLAALLALAVVQRLPLWRPAFALPALAALALG